MTTALKDLRADLTDHLADGLGVAGPALGAAVNPPLVLVRPASDYLVLSTYCTDAVSFDAWVLAPPGDPPAVMDALDDLVDSVRATLRDPSTAGHKYALQSISGHSEYPYGDRSYPAVVATVRIDREAPHA